MIYLQFISLLKPYVLYSCDCSRYHHLTNINLTLLGIIVSRKSLIPVKVLNRFYFMVTLTLVSIKENLFS